MDEEIKREKLIIDKNVTAPINISKAEAYKIVSEQDELNKEEKENNTVVTPTTIPKEELDLKKIEEVNEFIKNEYVENNKNKHSKMTYILLFIVLFILIGVIIFEIIYFKNIP